MHSINFYCINSVLRICIKHFSKNTATWKASLRAFLASNSHAQQTAMGAPHNKVLLNRWARLSMCQTANPSTNFREQSERIELIDMDSKHFEGVFYA